MSEFETLYTVDDIAKMTSLTTRTIRNHLKSGLLKGRKIGGQWRFTKKDIEQYMEHQEVSESMATEMKAAVLDFVDGVNTDMQGEVQICTIADLYVSHTEAVKKRDLLLAMTCEAGFSGQFKYDYDSEQKRARFILFAQPSFIKEAMDRLG